MLAASASAHGACADDPRERFLLEAGRGDEVNIVSGGWASPYAGECDSWQWNAIVRLALLRGREPPPAEQTIWVASLIPSLRYPIAQPFGARLYGEIGVGVSALSHTHINSERRMSTAFQFSELGGVTLEMGEKGAHSLSLRLQHISNGGIKRPNDGITFISLGYSWSF